MYKGIYIWGAYIRDIYLRATSVGVVCIEDAYASNISAKDTCVKNTSSAIGTCIKGVSPKDTCTEGAGRKSICTGGAGAVKYLRTYLQSFLILEVELFNTG